MTLELRKVGRHYCCISLTIDVQCCHPACGHKNLSSIFAFITIFHRVASSALLHLSPNGWLYSTYSTNVLILSGNSTESNINETILSRIELANFALLPLLMYSINSRATGCLLFLTFSVLVANPKNYFTRGQSRSWSAEQGKENKRRSLAAYPPLPPTLLVRRKK